MENCEMDHHIVFHGNNKGVETNLLTRTMHAIIRCRQRGIKEPDLDLIVLWGSNIRKPGGVREYFIGRKDKQRIIRNLKYLGNQKYLIQKLDKLVGKAIIVDEDHDVIITTYYKSN